jgi:transcriptional regulator with XRE-family HTH domain
VGDRLLRDATTLEVTIVTNSDYRHTRSVDTATDWQAGLGERLRQHRRAAGWNQERLAAAIEVDRSLVSRWESGTREPGLWELVRAARSLGVPVSTLVTGSSELPGGPDTVWRELGARGAPYLSAGTSPLWALRPLYESVAEALVHPDPRVIELLPGLLLLGDVPARGIAGLCTDWGIERRLGWVADVAVTLSAAGTLQAPAPRARALTTILELIPRPAAADPLDSLGFPSPAPGRLPPVFKRWRISYAGNLQRFTAAAEELAAARRRSRVP